MKRSFTFKTVAEGFALATKLSACCENREHVMLGLSELFNNAVEHGNLQIGYAAKGDLIRQDQWNDELSRRVAMPDFSQRQVLVLVTFAPTSIEFAITDAGEGFDWKPFLEISEARLFDLNGRGIALAKTCFQRLEFRGRGNQVVVTAVPKEPHQE